MKMKEDYHLQHVCSTLLKSQLYNIMTSINKKTILSKQTNDSFNNFAAFRYINTKRPSLDDVTYVRFH